jgi:hypothetical protein
MPQAPQFWSLVVVSTQTPPQSMRPPPMQAVISHLPPRQLWPAAHLTAHPPQLFGSFIVSTQTPLHSAWFGPQPTQAPSVQLWP